MDVLGLFMRVQQTNNKYSCKVPPGKINRRHIFRCFWWGGSGDGPCTICRGVFLSLFFMLRSVQEAFNHLHLQQSTPKGQTQMLLQIMMLNDNQGQITKVGSQGGTGSAPCSD